MEAYGLVGFYLMLQGIVQILDLGLSPTMNREMARYSATRDKAGEARDFVRTLEIGYWAIGICLGVGVFSAAPYIAIHWIKPGNLLVAEVQRAVAIMGALVALHWPLSFYQGGLLGLQRHVALNGISIASSALGSGGAVLILWRVSPTLSAFFSWQIAIGVVQVLMTTIALWRSLPPSGRSPRIVPSLIRQVGGFAAGMTGITLTALVLMQIDKVILSRLLDLKAFGYYVLACVVGNGLYVLISPMFNTVFPRFSEMVAKDDEKGLRDMYHGSTQLMAVLILPSACVIALFSHEIVSLWTGSLEIATHSAPIVSILVAGTALNGLMNLPFALQLAYGWTRIGLTINVCFIFILVPAIYYLTTRYGGIGAATAWFALNLVYMAVGVPLTHRRLLQGEAFRWFTRDAGLPLAGTLLVGLAARKVLPLLMGPWTTVSTLALTLVLATIVSTLVVPAPRDFVFGLVLGRSPSAEKRP